jgi:hypothetical protein
MKNESTNRRSHWQVIAAKRYPRFTYTGGDGGTFECWVVLTKCPHEQTPSWRYSLRPTKADAEVLLARWNKDRCAYQCEGAAQHMLWKLGA